MKGVLFLIKQNEPELAAAEAKAAMHGWGWWYRREKQVDGTIYFPKLRKIPQELALTRKVIKVLDVCSHSQLMRRLEKIEWNFRGTYRFCLTKQVQSDFTERELAMIIWNTHKPPVDLLNPDTILEVVITSKKAYIGVRAEENKGDFEVRRAHLLPAPHPTTMHPSFARAFINLACAEIIHDPFCGSGGILIEGCLAGKKMSGADINPKMLARAKKNLAAYYLKPELRLIDATLWLPRAAIVTDLPYGRSTKKTDLKILLEAFLLRAEAATNRIILGVPQKLPKIKGWHVRAKFQNYIHKSMTRHFYVLEKKK